ncbi:hypothetical protein ACFQL4_15895 [Halosimplex aquaticum]
MSVAPSGEVAWSKPFPDGGYDAELLGTGDESAGGPSATRAGLESRSRQITNPRVLAVSLVPRWSCTAPCSPCPPGRPRSTRRSSWPRAPS